MYILTVIKIVSLHATIAETIQFTEQKQLLVRAGIRTSGSTTLIFLQNILLYLTVIKYSVKFQHIQM